MKKKYNGWNDNKTAFHGVGGKPGAADEQIKEISAHLQPHKQEDKMDVIKLMAEKFADKCFSRDSFRWQKVVQYYTQGINDWLMNAEEKAIEWEREKEIERLKEENERLKETLKWYADPGNYLADDRTGKIVATAYHNDKIANKAKAALNPNP